MVKMPSLQKEIRETFEDELEEQRVQNVDSNVLFAWTTIKEEVLEELREVADKIRESFESFDVVDFLQRHNVKYDEWLKSQFFHLIKDLEKEVLGLLVEQEGGEKQ